MNNAELSMGQVQLVSDVLSLAIAAMLASFLFFVLVRQQMSLSYRPAMILSSLVVAIAGYPYLRIYTFRTGTAQIDLIRSLSMSAYGLHGIPTAVEAETWQKLVTALNACRG